jgi:NAD-dependent deacetylase
MGAYASSRSTRRAAERLAELIRSRQPCVVLTGAGVSTESGIPDFRSPEGIWAQYDPMEVASIDAFWSNPTKAWEFYARRLGLLVDAQPNPGHVALAHLEQAGWVEAIVTQNVDRLHELAGSRNVVEVHGSIRTSSCIECGERVALPDVVGQLEHAPVPQCPRCGSVLKPDVVMFGELMPEAAIDRAYALARTAGLLLVVGSSLEVYPVAALPQETLDHGGAVALVNRTPTRYDARAEIAIAASAAETLADVAALLS